jgi:flagellar biosynthesis protein FlhA
VTRAATEHDLGHDVLTQLSRYRRIVRTTGLVMAGLAIIPGLPKLPFLLIGGSVFFFGTRLPKDPSAQEAEPLQSPAAVTTDTPESIAAGIAVEQLVLELGLELIDLVQTERGGDLLDRVKALRRNVAAELGIVMPQVHTRDNLDLPASVYAIRVQGIEVARGEAPRGKLLAVGQNLEELAGVETRDPAFGGRAKWIPAELSHQAVVAGVTVVDRSAVVTTHLAEVVREHAGTILSRQDTKLLLDALKGSNPVVLEEMAAANVTLGDVQGVLRGLLDEGVPVRDLVRIVESTTEQARTQQKDGDSLLESARIALGSTIGSLFAVNGTIPIITMAPSLEQSLIASIRTGDRGRTLGIEASVAESLVRQVAKLSQEAESRGITPVLLCATRLRLALRRLLKPSLPRLAIVGAGEIGAAMALDTVGSVSDEAVVAP